MSKTQKVGHTPGPWQFTTYADAAPRPGFPCAVYGRDDEDDEDDVAVCVADFDDAEDLFLDEAMANARLIAAAPDLLEACRAAQAKLEALNEEHCDAGVKLDDAIAKATGLSDERH